MPLLSGLLISLCLAGTATAYRTYMSFVPNGDAVPCTHLPPALRRANCGGSAICEVWGHNECHAQGPITALGDAVHSAGWSEARTFPSHQLTSLACPAARSRNRHLATFAVCRADADGDGFSNGDELGDPCCRWGGGDADRRSGISHPDAANSAPPFAPCSQAVPDLHLPAVLGSSSSSLLVRLPPATAACICGLQVSTNASSSEWVRPRVDTREAALVLIPTPSGDSISEGDTVTITVSNLGGTVTTGSLSVPAPSTLQPNASLLPGSSPTPLQATSQHSSLEISQTLLLLLPLGFTLAVSLLSVAVCTHLPQQLTTCTACLLNVRGSKRKHRSKSYRLWQAFALLMTAGTVALNAVAYGELKYPLVPVAAIGRGLGVACIALLAAAVASASHHLLLHIAGVSFDRAVFGHLTLGTWAVLAGVAHGSWMVAESELGGTALSAEQTGGMYAAFAWEPDLPINPLAGFIAGLSLVFLLFWPSRRGFRTRCYAAFYALHITGAITAVVFSYLHLVNSGINSVIPLIVPLAVVLAENAALGGLLGVATAGRVTAAKSLSPSLVQVTVESPALPFPSAPGQWHRLLIPSLSLLPHPLSVAKAEAKDGKLVTTFIVRASHRPLGQLCAPRHTWSAAFVAAASDNSLIGSQALSVGPPFGSCTFDARLPVRHVLMAGGVGVTALLSHACHFAAACAPVHLVWACREPQLAEAGLRLLLAPPQQAGGRSSSPPDASIGPLHTLSVSLFLGTGTGRVGHEGAKAALDSLAGVVAALSAQGATVTQAAGRADVGAIIAAEAACAGDGFTGVYVCGPASLAGDVVQAAQAAPRTLLHEEQFGW